MGSIITVELGDDAVGQRLDRAVLSGLEQQGRSWTRSRLARAFARGDVQAAGVALKPGRSVDRAMTVTVAWMEPPLARAHPEAIELEVLHEDDDVLVVAKPAGMVVHVGPGHADGTLVNAVLHHLGRAADSLPVLAGNDGLRPGIVHRLDRDTSGVMVLAKNEHAAAHLADQFRRHSIDRVYLGVVEGVPSWSHLRVETLHGRDPNNRKRFSAAVSRGRRAVTEMNVVEHLQDAAWVQFRLETGRTHQIRMHARHVGHPILNDELYGRRHASPLGQALARHALHAQTLGFEHPRTGEFVTFVCALPPDLQALVGRSGTSRLP